MVTCPWGQLKLFQIEKKPILAAAIWKNYLMVDEEADNGN
jgi:hypothetical protein